VTARQVGHAFLASLNSRRLDLRSALGSFAVARHLRAHQYKAAARTYACDICGRISGARRDSDLNVLNFERHKWGGVRHTDPLYIALDLEQLAVTTVPVPSADGRSELISALGILGSLPKDAKLSAAEKSLASMITGNSAERRALLGILGYAGILQPPGRPGFFREFTRWTDRAERPLNKDDWPYPIRWWTPQDGVNQEALVFWFPGAAGA
jgi:hypothetical protein